MTSQTQNLTILPPTQETIPSFSRLTRTLLPINYGPKFFEASLQPPSPANAYSLARVANWNDSPNSGDKPQSQVIAGIYGRIQLVTDPEHQKPPECQLYIATLAVLAPWRGKGIAGLLLRSLVRAAVEFVEEARTHAHVHAHDQAQAQAQTDLALGQHDEVDDVWTWGPLTAVCAHVWEVNDGGLGWYCKQGFETGELLKGYYRKLRPDGARLVRRGVVGLLVDGKDDEGVAAELW